MIIETFIKKILLSDGDDAYLKSTWDDENIQLEIQNLRTKEVFVGQCDIEKTSENYEETVRALKNNQSDVKFDLKGKVFQIYQEENLGSESSQTWTETLLKIKVKTPDQNDLLILYSKALEEQLNLNKLRQELIDKTKLFDEFTKKFDKLSEAKAENDEKRWPAVIEFLNSKKRKLRDLDSSFKSHFDESAADGSLRVAKTPKKSKETPPTTSKWISPSRSKLDTLARQSSYEKSPVSVKSPPKKRTPKKILHNFDFPTKESFDSSEEIFGGETSKAATDAKSTQNNKKTEESHDFLSGMKVIAVEHSSKIGTRSQNISSSLKRFGEKSSQSDENEIDKVESKRRKTSKVSSSSNSKSSEYHTPPNQTQKLLEKSDDEIMIFSQRLTPDNEEVMNNSQEDCDSPSIFDIAAARRQSQRNKSAFSAETQNWE